jgi:acyl-coenzyme A thioesterase PaaI-like protein
MTEPSDGRAGPDGALGGDPSLTPDPELVRSIMSARWQDIPTSQLTTRVVEMRRLADSMRIIIERLVATAAPTEANIDAADELARVALAFDRMPQGSVYAGFSEAANAGGDPQASFEHSPFTGRANPISPPITLQEIDGLVHARAVFGAAYEGPPGCVHGGYVAAAFDEVLGATQSLSGAPGMTGTLTIKYRSPTPLHEPLHFVGRLSRVEGRKIFTDGTLYAGERLCAEAEGIFISIDPLRFRDLIEQRSEAEQERLAARTSG